MFRQRPLTWLFVIASVVVDGATWVAGAEHLLEGLVVGQVAALSIWAAVGNAHRMTRAAVVIMAIAFLALLPDDYSLVQYCRWLTMLSIYALAVWTTSLVFLWLEKQVLKRRGKAPQQEVWRFPLIEFFGWTILVAIACAAVRHMDPRVVERIGNYPSLYVWLYLMVPAALVLFPSRFRLIYLVKAVLFVAVIYAISKYSIRGKPWFRPTYVLGMSTAAGYLAAWMLVRSIEKDQVEAVQQPKEEDDSQTNPLQSED